MKFMDDRYVHHQVLHPSQLDIFDKQISSALPTAFRDIPNSGHIARALTDGLERLQEDLVRVISVAGVFLTFFFDRTMRTSRRCRRSCNRNRRRREKTNFFDCGCALLITGDPN